MSQQVNYYVDSNPDDPGGSFSTYPQERLAEVKYGRFAEWYGYMGPGAAAKKRLQLTQPLTWQDTQGYGHNASPTINFDASSTYDHEGKMTSVRRPRPPRPPRRPQ